MESAALAVLYARPWRYSTARRGIMHQSLSIVIICSWLHRLRARLSDSTLGCPSLASYPLAPRPSDYRGAHQDLATPLVCDEAGQAVLVQVGHCHAGTCTNAC